MKSKIELLPGMVYLSMMIVFCTTIGCQQTKEEVKEVKETVMEDESHDYFLLRPELEKTYGYSHAVKIGNDLKISGAVSMDNEGNLLGAGNMEEQMKNCYKDLEKVLSHYGYTFDDVIVENVFTTDMAEFINVSGYRATLYKNHFPTGTWLQVSGLALPGQMIEIDMEAHKSH